MSRLFVFLVALIMLVAVPAAWAQTGRDARLNITVTDPSGAVVPGAVVTLTGLEDATRSVRVPPAKTSEKGLGTLEGLVPGRYAVQASFAGESHLDMIALELGIDPLELRLRNVVRAGETGPAHERYRDEGLLAFVDPAQADFTATLASDSKDDDDGDGEEL